MMGDPQKMAMIYKSHINSPHKCKIEVYSNETIEFYLPSDFMDQFMLTKYPKGETKKISEFQTREKTD